MNEWIAADDPSSSVQLFDKFKVILEKIESQNIESNIIGDKL